MNVANMPRNKSTRWDCDVGLWRGIPVSNPSFHGWMYTGSDPPCTDTKFYVCHHCNTNVPERSVAQHPCWDEPVVEIKDEPLQHGAMEPEEFKNHWEDGFEEECKEEEGKREFLIATDDNTKDQGRCSLCTEKMKLEFDLDLENWILPGCIMVDGKTMHRECHDVVFL